MQLRDKAEISFQARNLPRAYTDRGEVYARDGRRMK